MLSAEPGNSLDISRTPLTSTTSRVLNVAANIFGAVGIGFGVNAILRPAHALSFFEFALPTSTADKHLVESLMTIYGVRDIFMGAAVHATAYYGSRKALGWIIVANSGVAFVDGLVCKMNGHGEMNHWGYAPILTVVGCLFIGGF